ncbi:MAG: BamA/TamA family outer membrane protein [Deltaproteobacteria bacterium]|nr:BamA/TamA family outer membrane protein [Deltaproteobacteria bacterium]
MLIFALATVAWASGARADPTRTATVAVSTASVAPDGQEPDADVFDAAFADEAAPFDQEARFVEAVEVVGNTKTDRQVILERIQVEVGDLVNEARIEESRLRLLGTGFFKSVEFSLRRGSNRGRVLLVVEVEERNTILVDELYLGYSRVSPFFGGFGLAETNFLGRGVTVGGSFVLGRDRRSLELRAFAPSISGTPLQISGSAILLQGAEVLDEDDLQGQQLTYRRLGGTLGVGFRVGMAQRVSLIYRLESVRADRLPNLDPALLRQAPSIQFDDSVLSSLTARYERDTRDDPFMPTQGNRVALTAEVGTTLIGSTYEFSKYTVELSQAFLLFEEHSLELHFYGGLVQGHTPFFNQFFISDFAYFAWNRDSLPRNAQLNFSESNDYDDLVASAGAIYGVPVLRGKDLLYRMWLYGGLEFTATASLDELQEDPTGRGVGGTIPLSFDLGVKFDTFIGNFTLSLSYMLDLVF